MYTTSSNFPDGRRARKAKVHVTVRACTHDCFITCSNVLSNGFCVQEQMEVYKERMKAINARPIKKIAEAKARKKRKVSQA